MNIKEPWEDLGKEHLRHREELRQRLSIRNLAHAEYRQWNSMGRRHTQESTARGEQRLEKQKGLNRT